ncbi:MAG: arginase family protein [Coprococcus sp.]
MIAGDHSAAMGSVSATSVYTKGETGVIWIDAHPDINTDKTTVTGNIHGMPVAALLGLGEPFLTHFLDDSIKLKSGNIVMLGLRDIDPPEAEILKEHHIRYYKWDYIMEHGLQNCLNESIDYLSHCPAVHVSFDIDSMDPKLMPGVSVPVPEGFNEDDVFLMMDELLTRLPVQAMDIVEFNHELDKDDITAGFVSRLVEHVQGL